MSQTSQCMSAPIIVAMMIRPKKKTKRKNLSWSLALDAVRKRLQAQKLHQHDREGQRLSKKRDLLAETVEEDLLFLGLAGGEATSSTSQSGCQSAPNTGGVTKSR